MTKDPRELTLKYSDPCPVCKAPIDGTSTVISDDLTTLWFQHLQGGAASRCWLGPSGPLGDKGSTRPNATDGRIVVRWAEKPSGVDLWEWVIRREMLKEIGPGEVRMEGNGQHYRVAEAWMGMAGDN